MAAHRMEEEAEEEEEDWNCWTSRRKHYQSTRRNVPQDFNVQQQRCQNLKPLTQSGALADWRVSYFASALLPFFLSVFLIMTSFYLLIVGIDGYCYSWLHSMTNIHSVGLPWTRDRPVAKSSTWQHTIVTRDRHQCPGRDLNPQCQQASGRRPTS